MSKTIRVGILGCGGIFNAHATPLKTFQDEKLCKVVAVAESNPERRKVILERFGPDTLIFSDYREVLALPEIEAVDILLPHHLHMPATIAAAEAGKHILVEKVMARNVYECDQMIAACEKAGVSLTICHDRRYHGEWQALKEIVDSGVLGEIFFWKMDHNQDVTFSENTWMYSRDSLGGGAIMSCLTHQIDALRWYGGEVESVTCMSTTRPERMEGEFAGVVLAKMKSGALAELSINWWTRSNKGDNSLWYEMVQVCGSRGEAYRMNGRGTFIKLHEANDEEIGRYGNAVLENFVPVEAGSWGGHHGCIREWLGSLRGESAGIVTSGRECRGTVEVAEAAYLSEASGEVVKLPIPARAWRSSDSSKTKKSVSGTPSAPQYHVDMGSERKD